MLKDDVINTLKQWGVSFCPISKSVKMNVVAQFAKLLGYKNFKETYWLTLGKTIYHPDHIDPLGYLSTIEHELLHVQQQHRHGLALWLFRYLTSGKFRYFQEREAYLLQVKNGSMSVGQAVACLSTYKTGVDLNEMADWFESKTC
jgi:hypothetical protein